MCLLVVCAVSGQRGISSLGGIQDSELPRGGEESRASVVFRVVSVEGSGFNPEALKCGPRVGRSHLAVLWKGVTEGDRQMWRSMGGGLR